MDDREIDDAFRLNVGGNLDRMYSIVTGTYRPPSLPGEPEKITRSIVETEAWQEKAARRYQAPATEGEESEGEESSVKRVGANQPSYRPSVSANIPQKYAYILKELDRFEFSEDNDKFKEQMEAVVGGIRTALHSLVIRAVAANTRSQFKEYVSDIASIGGGIKVNFNFSGTKVSMSARGPFTGDETICVSRRGDKLIGNVMKIDEHGEVDLTANFGIVLGE